MWGYTLTITWSLVARTVNNPQKTSGVTIAIQYLSDTTVLHDALDAHMERFYLNPHSIGIIWKCASLKR